MKRLNSKRIKKIIFGIIASDGYVDERSRLALYNKNEEYILHTKSILENITGIRCHIYKAHDSRFNVDGYRLTTNVSPYFKKIRKIFYETGRKKLTSYIVSRFDFETLAHIWMCDGYLLHHKNRKTNKIQNIGYFCLESFPKEELNKLIAKLSKMGIYSRLQKVRWGFGYRIKISGLALQKFIDDIIKYIIPCFEYKTLLYYKSRDYLDSNLQNTKQFIRIYNDIEDIVRHS